MGARSAGATVASAPPLASGPSRRDDAAASRRPASRTRTTRSAPARGRDPAGTRAGSRSRPSGPPRGRRGRRLRARGRGARTTGCRAPEGRRARGAGCPGAGASRNAAIAKASRPRASATRRSSEPGSGARRGARRAARSAASAGQPSPASDCARTRREEEVVAEDRASAVAGRVRRPPVHRERRDPAAARDLPHGRHAPRAGGDGLEPREMQAGQHLPQVPAGARERAYGRPHSQNAHEVEGADPVALHAFRRSRPSSRKQPDRAPPSRSARAPPLLPGGPRSSRPRPRRRRDARSPRRRAGRPAAARNAEEERGDADEDERRRPRGPTRRACGAAASGRAGPRPRGP